MTEYLKLEKKPLYTKGIPKAEYRKGESEELEHTSNRRIAKQISLDHLHEDKHYYSNMDKKSFDLESVGIGAGVGALAGGAVGFGGLSKDKKKKEHAHSLKGRALGAGIGALAGGAMGDGISNISKQAFERGFVKAAIDNGIKPIDAVQLLLKARHPYATSLPFGDMIGAAMA